MLLKNSESSLPVLDKSDLNQENRREHWTSCWETAETGPLRWGEESHWWRVVLRRKQRDDFVPQDFRQCWRAALGLCAKVSSWFKKKKIWERGVRGVTLSGQGRHPHSAPFFLGLNKRKQGSEVQRGGFKLDTGENFLALRDLVFSHQDSLCNKC